MTVAADPNSLHGFSKPQVEKAASGLLAHLRKNSKGGGGGKGNDLFEDDDELLYMVRVWTLVERFFQLLQRGREKDLLGAFSCVQRSCEGKKGGTRAREASNAPPDAWATAASFFANVDDGGRCQCFQSLSRTHSLVLPSPSPSFTLESQIVSLKKMPQERRNDKPVRMYARVFFAFSFSNAADGSLALSSTSTRLFLFSSTPPLKSTEPSRTRSTASKAPRSA